MGAEADEEGGGSRKGMRLGNKYELGRTLGEGNFGKVRHATDAGTGAEYAVKILDKRRVLDQRVHEQIKREIGTLKLLRHPNVVRLHEVLASKTKIYMVLEYVTGGELFDKIALKGRLRETEGRRLFQQLIDAVGYCHEKGVYHRDLKPENVLVDAQGNIKISDFGLSALPQHLGRDGLFHTTCGSPNYVAPEVLSNRGYDGAMSDIWSCGVILYVVLTGYLPFDDRNLAVLYQKIFKGDAHIPRWLSPGAKSMIRRILDPNPRTRINVEGIKSDAWFRQGYVPAVPDEDDHDIDTFSITEIADGDTCGKLPSPINAFELIGMSSSLDLSGLFESEDVTQRKTWFTSTHSHGHLLQRMEAIACDMGYNVHKRPKKQNVIHLCENTRRHSSLSVAVEVYELGESLSVVETRKLQGDLSLYKELYTKFCDELSICRGQPLLTGAPSKVELPVVNREMPVTAS